MIKNKRNTYIRLDENGRFVSCSEKLKGTFEYSKACNIVQALPKQLKKMGFYVEAIPDIPEPKPKVQQKVIENTGYEPSDNVTRWVGKIGAAREILQEAIDREPELTKELSTVDKERSDILHEIEFTESFHMYIAWKWCKRLWINARKRRDIKNEMDIVEDIIESFDKRGISKAGVQANINKCKQRKYRYRIVEVTDEEGNEVDGNATE